MEGDETLHAFDCCSQLEGLPMIYLTRTNNMYQEKIKRHKENPRGVWAS